MANIYEDITSNKRHSVLLIGLFIAVLLVLGEIFGRAFGVEYFGLAFALLLAIMMALISYYHGDKMVLRINNAHEAKREKYPGLFYSVEGLAIAAGVPTPKIYVMDDPSPNAFATGRDPQHASITVTTGLLRAMNRMQLEGVISHEIAHIKNYDIRLSMLAAVLAGAIVMLADMFIYSAFWGRGNERDESSLVFLAIGIVLAIFSPLIAEIIQLAISRQREYLADATGALLTRYPEGLASALEVLKRNKTPLRTASKATAHMFIANPLKNHQRFMDSLFDTHPPIDERINRLRAM
jgi:heat shock protein HtpX